MMEGTEVKVGQTVKVEATVEAMRIGLNHGGEVRVKVGDTSLWVKLDKVSE